MKGKPMYMKMLPAVLFLLLFTSTICAQSEEYDTTGVIMDTLIAPEPDPYETEEPSTSDKVVFNRMSIDDKPVFQNRLLPDSTVKNLRGRDEFWYADYMPGLKKKEEKKEYVPLFQRKWFRSLLWVVIIAGFLAFLAIYLQSVNVGLFRNSRKVSSGSGNDEDVLTDDIFAINYSKEIDKAVNNGNYRFATRLMFLRLLRDLSNRKVISYGHEKTNLDYMMQLGSTTYFQDFSRVARNYEYVWYGHFDVDETRFRMIERDFQNINSKI